jgi:hypothetical protein
MHPLLDCSFVLPILVGRRTGMDANCADGTTCTINKIDSKVLVKPLFQKVVSEGI